MGGANVVEEGQGAVMASAKQAGGQGAVMVAARMFHVYFARTNAIHRV